MKIKKWKREREREKTEKKDSMMDNQQLYRRVKTYFLINKK